MRRALLFAGALVLVASGIAFAEGQSRGFWPSMRKGLPLSGGTTAPMTGPLCFEGSTVDAYETCLTVTDPASSDKTVTFQNVTGTVYVSSGTDVALADGGTNASLTASNGGICYSTATALAILSGTATAGLGLLSGSSTTPTWGGAHVESGIQSFNSTTTLSPSGTTQTVDWSLGNIQKVDVENTSGNLTVTLSGAVNNSRLTLIVQQSTANPTRTVTLTGAKWPSGVAPTFTQVADAIDIVSCVYADSTYRCAWAGNES